jgi:tRNA dimethylallyltransferase
MVFMLPAPFQNALVLTGPTGSGKTRLALELALELAAGLNAEIISMDSMALYRGMDIGTAKPTRPERERVPHHLIDVLDPWQSSSVAWWLEQAVQAALEIERRGRQVLFVGGTPLYLKALIFGLFDGPAADRALRQRLENDAARHGSAFLHERLGRVDPLSAARLHPNDTRRLVRALEVFELTGKPISAWQTQWSDQGEPGGVSPRSESSILWLDLPRSALYERINERVVRMFDEGLVEEVHRLAENSRGLSREARQALGYKEVLSLLDGGLTKEEAIAQVQLRTRNFAKRQITWFRHLPGCRPATRELTRTLWEPKMHKGRL